jgi:hypothetical protein
MIKRPSFPLVRATERPPHRSFDHRLTVIALVLATIAAVGLLVRAAGFFFYY